MYQTSLYLFSIYRSTCEPQIFFFYFLLYFHVYLSYKVPFEVLLYFLEQK